MITTQNPEALGWKYSVEGITTRNGKITNWPAGLPDLTQALVDQAETEYLANIAQESSKMEGVLFEGVMCSATKEDMWGLSAIESWVAAGNSVPFQFANGNVLVLTPANHASFKTTWVAFRASFFPLP